MTNHSVQIRPFVKTDLADVVEVHAAAWKRAFRSCLKTLEGVNWSKYERRRQNLLHLGLLK
jgi:hypothetical protein